MQSTHRFNIALSDGTTDYMWSHDALYAQVINGDLVVYYPNQTHPAKCYAAGEWHAFYAERVA